MALGVVEGENHAPRALAGAYQSAPCLPLHLGSSGEGAKWLLEAAPATINSTFTSSLSPPADRDTDHLDRLGHQLGTELRQTDIGSISAMGSDEIPAFDKGAEVTSLTEWLITLSARGCPHDGGPDPA